MTYALYKIVGHRKATLKLGPKDELNAWVHKNHDTVYSDPDGDCIDLMAVRGGQADIYAIEPVKGT